MTQIEQIEMVRNMVGNVDDSFDDIALAYLSIAGQSIINRCFPYRHDVVEVPEKYHIKQCEIAVYLINKRGAEGETSHNENGINRTYESADIPASMLKDVRPYLGVI